MTKYDNTASVGITFVDELHNFDLKKCRALFGDHKEEPISFPEPALPLSSGTGTRGSGIKRFRSQDSCYEDSTAQAQAPVTKWSPIFSRKR